MPTKKRAWLYVRRNTKRTVLLFLLFTILMTISLLGFTLHTASSAAVKELRGSIGGYFTIQTGADGTQRTGDTLAQQVAALDNIRRCNGVDTYYMYTEGLELVSGSNHGTGLTGEFMPKFIGCTDTSLHERFLANSFQLADGRHITSEDVHKVVLCEEVAQKNGLSIGDTVTASVVQGVRDWRENAFGTQVGLEIVGIYSTTRSEAVSPGTPECDLQENILFTDINTAKELYLIKFPNRTPEDYTYSSGLMFFLEDPARMEETVSRVKQQPFADWDKLVLSQNSAAYQQAAAPIRKTEVISLLLLFVILAISVGILSLVLLMWTRERMTEIGILISIGLSAKGICGQMLLENYIVAAPAFVVAVLLSAVGAGQAGRLVGGVLDSVSLNAGQVVVVFVCAAAVILVTVLLASVSIMRKKPKEILIDLS